MDNLEKTQQEVLHDIEGSENLEHEYGNPLRGWYLKKTLIEKKDLPLNYKGLSYNFEIYNYNYQFIMPPVLQFSTGTITYSEPERLFGLFRFPTDNEGKYRAPINMGEEDIIKLSPEDIKNLLNKKGVLTFEAFKIPQFGFNFFNLKDLDFQNICKMTDNKFFVNFKSFYYRELSNKKGEVRDKIKALPNYLLILQNVLDRYWKDLKEIEIMSNKIIRYTL